MIEIGSEDRLQTFLRKFNGSGFYALAPMARFSIYATFFPNKKECPGAKPDTTVLYELMGSKDGKSGILNDLTYFVQDVTLPQMKVDKLEQVETVLGNIQLVNSQPTVTPESNMFSFQVLNTKTPVIENVFYPWMRETTTPYWNYMTQPYTTAKIIVSMKDSDVSYVFTGCRPCRIEPYRPTHDPSAPMTREVQLLFNYMYITSTSSAMGGQLADQQIRDAETAHQKEFDDAQAQKAAEAKGISDKQTKANMKAGQGGVSKRQIEMMKNSSDMTGRSMSNIG